MQNTCFKRLRKEALALQKGNDDEFVRLFPDKENIKRWVAIIKAPPDTAYEGYLFELSIEVGDDYPLSPPNMKFVTRIFHPNIYFTTGEICLDILKKEWSPAWGLQSASRAIVALLEQPEPDSPLNCDAGNMLRAGDNRAYRSCCRLYCEEFARPASEFETAGQVH
jgi:peroxin-4